MTEQIEPGIYFNLSFDEYKAIDALNNGILVTWEGKTPAHSQIEKKDTPQMRLGRRAHRAILEPDKFDRDKCTAPELEAIDGILESLKSGKHETARKLIESSEREVTIVWVHSKTGILCKCRIDLFHRELGIIGDLKTSTNANPHQWIKTACNANLNPHFQPHWYLQGANSTLHGKETFHTFLWILLETKEPYLISVFPAHIDDIYLASQQINNILPQYAESKSSGIFQGYPDKIMSGIRLPSFFIKNVQI